MSHVYLESHGVKLDVEVQDDELLPLLERILPPGWEPLDDFPEDGHFTLARSADGTYTVSAEGSPITNGLTAELAVHVLDAQLRARIALLAKDRIFVHAGAVAVEGRAIALPAPSFAGKSALVAALVSRGAEYFSDEFAVLDREGAVHPYPKPLSIRAAEERQGALNSVESFGGTAGSAPARIALIAVTRYVPGARWEPRARDAGAGALALLTNAVPAQERKREATRAAARAAAGAVVLEGDRGEAGETADGLLAQLANLA